MPYALYSITELNVRAKMVWFQVQQPKLDVFAPHLHHAQTTEIVKTV